MTETGISLNNPVSCNIPDCWELLHSSSRKPLDKVATLLSPPKISSLIAPANLNGPVRVKDRDEPLDAAIKHFAQLCCGELQSTELYDIVVWLSFRLCPPIVGVTPSLSTHSHVRPTAAPPIARRRRRVHPHRSGDKTKRAIDDRRF